MDLIGEHAGAAETNAADGGHTLKRANPTEPAAAPFASGVPTVTFGENCDGGLHEPKASGGPCSRLGDSHGL